MINKPYNNYPGFLLERAGLHTELVADGLAGALLCRDVLHTSQNGGADVFLDCSSCKKSLA